MKSINDRLTDQQRITLTDEADFKSGKEKEKVQKN